MESEKKKLNIAMVCDPIGSNKSGVVVSTLRFGKLLKERGHNIIFVGAKSEEHHDHSFHNDIKTYRYRSLPIPKSGGWHLAFPTTAELKKVFQKENIEVVHLILPMTGAIVAMRAAKELRLKIVAHSHSQPENLFTDAPKIIQPFLNSLWNKYLSWLYAKADVLIYPSELAKSLLHNLSRPDQPSRVVSNGINTEEFKPLPIGDFLERFKIPKHKTYLLFLGRLYPEKSLDTLIRAMPHIVKSHPDVHLLMVGGGHQRDKLEKLVRKLQVVNHVSFLGLVTEEDKINAYNASSIFVLPSIAELEGMVILEAMACGKPIIVADAPMSASRYFVNGNGFLFKALDSGDLAKKVS